MHRTSLVVWWLRCPALDSRCRGLIPGQGTKILHATWHDPPKKKAEGKKKKIAGIFFLNIDEQ